MRWRKPTRETDHRPRDGLFLQHHYPCETAKDGLGLDEEPLDTYAGMSFFCIQVTGPEHILLLTAEKRSDDLVDHALSSPYIPSS
ncbi:Uncharacterised protein [Slackia heliotrinireducens]|uniref:Uncharacterized protein n=1 Tax=Slackia heliotrinireducens (strain ATCC 29202 / DSM 20476 / NCTC 11029 / RHS 1) TaxID=471855 RepID=C7N295_SLAHD|nr:hypothetical protein Shel_03340 [Slackia heliotrinireducens DSM 20476]VEG98835.1 Uncharacterised protein [Slackia heliotrinireducens]